MVRRAVDGSTKNVNVSEISLERCAKRCAEVAGIDPKDAWSGPLFGAKLHTFGTELAEGFFARCAVLVEGVGDQAVLHAWYAVNGRDPHAEGVVIAQVSGKYNLDKPIVIFEELGIPCYWVFDNDESDKKKKKEQSAAANRRLQALGGIAEGDRIDWPVGRFPKFASWDTNLEKYVQDKAGPEMFAMISEECAKHFDIDSGTCLKFPASAAHMLRKMKDGGVSFSELDEILTTIDERAAS